MLAATAVPWPSTAIAQGSNRERRIKAAFLYNFGRYVTWPASSSGGEKDPFVIGVLGIDHLGGALDAVAAAKKVHGREIVIRRFKSLDEYTACHILLVTKDMALVEQLRAIRRLGRSPVLLVGETPGFAYRGGHINFYIEANNIRFEINNEAAKRAQLKIGAQLLRLKREPRDENRAAWEEARRKLQ